ncbi:ECF transporter S component [Anaerotalea alkaliphila]|uniref:ECF transporter S component n=1 Tax=Anaerotalea alkaliphila TaxID=2662126 RepID=A0A7X5HU09_9FIRM|nr:ECF transporter S component [Anaerotalea alkaliphila]NDL66643.1 ECF transporter S component [Anaerotalea alkaliphila]
MAKTATKKLVLAGLFLALGLVLPFLTGQVPALGNRLLPMHIPVLLCGFVCGWPYGLAVGFITPLFRSLLFGMPPLFPMAAAMAFELAAYGGATGILYRIFPKRPGYVYGTLLLAMLGGRIVWGGASLFLLGLAGAPFTWQLFLAGAFLNALPGIAIQLLLIPVLVLALQKVPGGKGLL